MKSDIEYYYNIHINKLNTFKNNYSFEYNLEKYYFVMYQRPIEDLKDLYNVTIELRNKNISCHQFVLNKNNKIITNIDNTNYVMLKVEQDNQEIDLIDIMKFQNSLILTKEQSKLYRNDWANLWSEKVDYFEYQISEIGKDKELILNSFSYYIGLAENAISYVNNIMSSNNMYILTLSHKRIFTPNYALNFYNPLSFIFDLQVRDIAEYLKSAFFNNENSLKELEYYLNHKKLSDYEYKMLYARLLYPSYYFDIYERIMDNKVEEKELLKIISKVDDYEIFLKQSYLLINRYTQLEGIDWIMKKEVNTP